MKNLIAGFAIVLATTQANAGSLNFECDAANINKDGEITKLRLKGFGAVISSDYEDTTLETESVGTMEEEQIYKLGKQTFKMNVKLDKPLKSVNGNYGKREFSVDSYLATITVRSGKKKSQFQGICIEKLVTTCGGEC